MFGNYLNSILERYGVQKISHSINKYLFESEQQQKTEYKNNLENFGNYGEFDKSKGVGVWFIARPVKVYSGVLCGGCKCIATMVLPSGSSVVVPNYSRGIHKGRLRADQALIVKIECPDSVELDDCKSYSLIDKENLTVITNYKIGSVVKPFKELDTNCNEIFTHGVNFFATKKEVENDKL